MHTKDQNRNTNAHSPEILRQICFCVSLTAKIVLAHCFFIGSPSPCEMPPTKKNQTTSANWLQRQASLQPTQQANE